MPSVMELEFNALCAHVLNLNGVDNLDAWI